MLQPRIQKVSPKGQVVIPAQFRRDFGIEKKGLVMMIPVVEEKKLVLKAAPKDAIGQAAGTLSSWKKPATVIMRQARKEERRFEKEKFRNLHLR